VLIGMMGAGKTTVGRRVAAHLGRPFADSDATIEQQTGRTVAQIFADEGEAAFRSLETEVLRAVLDAVEPTVIAAAGGTVLDPGNRTWMRRRGTVVWLRADPLALVDRVGHGTHRPLLDDDPAATLVRLAAERAPLYAETADQVVDVDALSPDEVVRRVLDVIGVVA
jgi:shikimate kinase